MEKNKKTTKYIPYAWWFEDYNKTELVCMYEVGYYDKYGLHYKNPHTNSNKHEEVHLKGRQYRQKPFAWDSYDEMIRDLKQIAIRNEMIEDMGNIRKKAIYLVLDIDRDGNLKHDACDIHGYVSKRGTVFNVVDSYAEGIHKKQIELTDENKHLIFPSISKAAKYVFENYGDWAGNHYLKSRYDHV